MSEIIKDMDTNDMMHKIVSDWCRIINCNDRWMAAHHYTNSHSKIIIALWDEKDGCTQSDICRKSGVSKQQVSAVLKEFEQNQYITRVRHNDDERFNKVVLTDHGREMCGSANDDFCELFKSVVKNCTDKERDNIMNAFDCLAKIYTKALDERGY